ncbi:PREDICTED: tetratricopeptide repeat protein 1 [Populus euphratica]|uniref:Tetratricopeptide repeat protein 1 n=1 Tax=Populus euphratica TaxID=75702 RepID=A0AAJ6TUY8_POPEU|nr:PREDICTED: tetratricopeptide repeat protein 1 [Populus euphratica]
MVVIDPEETVLESTPKPPQPAPSTSKTTTDSTSSETTTTTTKAAAAVKGSDSDGFETASESGVSDNEEEQEENVNKEISSKNTTEDQPKQDTQNHDELIQRGIEEANEAKLEGNRLFGNGQYEEALLQYDVALQVSPPDVPSSIELRSVCHSNRGVCFLKLGKFEDTIKECSKALELNPSYMKALVRRGEAHEKLEHFEEAIADMKKILELDPSNDQAKRTIRRLEPLAAAKREKMKEEMIGKLKDMGNSLLGRFGMSVDNFKAVQDPNTGSYSISFQR